MSNVIRSKDFLAGVFFLLFGLLALFFGRELELGSAAQMGAGYFPMLIAAGLTLLGLAAMAKGMRAVDHEFAFPLFLRPVFFIAAGIVAFALTVRSAGFLIACALMLGCAALASVETRWREALLASIAVIAASVAIFIWGLSLPIPILPA